MHLFGETPRGLVDREDFLRENLGNVLCVIDFTNKHQGFVNLNQVIEFVVILVYAKHSKFRFQIFDRGNAVGFVGLSGDAPAHFADQTSHAHDGAAG